MKISEFSSIGMMFMKKYLCSVHYGMFADAGCIMTVNAEGIIIKLLFSNILSIPAKDIKKIINFKKSRFLKIELQYKTAQAFLTLPKSNFRQERIFGRSEFYRQQRFSTIYIYCGGK